MRGMITQPTLTQAAVGWQTKAIQSESVAHFPHQNTSMSCPLRFHPYNPKPLIHPQWHTILKYPTLKLGIINLVIAILKPSSTWLGKAWCKICSLIYHYSQSTVITVHLANSVAQHNAQQSRLVSHLVKGLSGSRACRVEYSQLRREEMQVYCTGEECRLSIFLIYGKLVPMIHPCLFAQKWWVKVSKISHFQWHLIHVQPRTLQNSPESFTWPW